MNPHPALSSYLIKPALAKPKLSWSGLLAAASGIRRSNPNLLSRTAAVLVLWSLITGMFQAAASTHVTAYQPNSQFSAASLPVAGAATVSSTHVATAQQASELAVGPTGQMLAPIPMAATGSFRNSYAYGECTWYVAGRRQVPRNWGNANTWYARAAAAGWNVGAIPAVGAIAQTSAGSLGHVALIEQISPDYQRVYVSEMNYVGRGVKSYRWASAGSFRYIY